MRLFDQHLHSWNSFDSNTPPVDNVQEAIRKGLSGLTFTEHFDTHPSEWDACIYDDAKIESELAALREQFGDRIFIGKGIEICYQPERMGFILDFLAAHHFDVVILSVHWAFGRPIHEREHFVHLTPDQYIVNHLEAVRAATAQVVALGEQGVRPFDVLGHLDFAKRYAKQFHEFTGAVSAPDLIDDILRNCLQAGLIPEVNTSTLRNGLDAPMPGLDVMRRYAALGGTSMSLGSDAHRAICIGSHFDVVLDLMRKAGLRSQAVFQNRRLEMEPIASAA